MKRERFNELMDNDDISLTPEEIAEGWHFCRKYDGLLVKGDPTKQTCGDHCVDVESNSPPFE